MKLSDFKENQTDSAENQTALYFVLLTAFYKKNGEFVIFYGYLHIVFFQKVLICLKNIDLSSMIIFSKLRWGTYMNHVDS